MGAAAVTAFIPTTLVSILRGEATDTYGDPVDADVVIAESVPASIIEQSQDIGQPADSRTTKVRVFAGRIRPQVDTREGDRWRDETDLTIYLVEAVSRPQSPFGAADARCDLRRIDDQP